MGAGRERAGAAGAAAAPAGPLPETSALARWRAALTPAVRHARAHLTEAMVSLQANKVRAGLSTLGIAIGVGAVIAMLALGTGARRNMAERMASFGTNVISVEADWYQPRGRGSNEVITRLTIADAAALLRAHPAIRRTSPTVWSGGTLTWNGKDWSPGGMGVTPNYEFVRSCHPIAGRFFTAEEDRDRARVLLLGTTVVRQLFGEQANPVGQTVRLNRVPFTVIGLLPEKPGWGGHWDPNDTILVPLGTAMYRMSGKRYVDRIDIELAADADIDDVIDKIKAFLAVRYRLKGGKEDAFEVRNEVAWRQAGAAITNTVTLLLGIVAAISLAVGGIGIMNIMLVSVTERTREIGLRKAVGARRNDILNQFLIEAVTISVGGGILGILFGCGVAFILAVAVHWTVAVTPWSVALSFCFSAAVGVGFGFWPAWRAAALHPAEALRYE
jgi:macrolide transport system ATP-binding/permease protein